MVASDVGGPGDGWHSSQPGFVGARRVTTHWPWWKVQMNQYIRACSLTAAYRSLQPRQQYEKECRLTLLWPVKLSIEPHSGLWPKG